MLCYDLRILAEHPIAVDGVLPPDDAVWAADDLRPTADGVQVAGRLSNAGPGRYYFSGRLAGHVGGECRRCLTNVEVAVADEVHVVFAEPGDAEVEDDPDVFLLDARGGELDLRPAVREQWLLAAPALVQCREDCRGLCPSCGTDLNSAPCECPPATDVRWDALRSARDERA